MINFQYKVMDIYGFREGENMKYYIITGTSSRIGEALAKRILNKEEKNQVISLSRRGNIELEKLAEIRKK